MNKPVADLSARLEALDVGRSFIVQAPAGSGKTELLIQRYLALLATVDAPEEIAAITFTRKAAAEMAQRVLAALDLASVEVEPEEAHRALTWKLARAAAKRDAALGWEIAQNPSRLRMQTIDSLCASLTRQMPLVARFGAQPAVTEEADALYLEAACNTLALLEDKGSEADDVAMVLSHLDNNVPQVVGLLAAMLRKRDQWLRHLGRADDRAALEEGLRRIRREAMRAMRHPRYPLWLTCGNAPPTTRRICPAGWASPSCCSPRRANGARGSPRTKGSRAKAAKPRRTSPRR
jgi:ATP-dependent helicase/nuclease subunit A